MSAVSKPPLRREYQPLDWIHPNARHNNIAIVPQTDKLLRWYPHQDTWDTLRNSAEARQRIALRSLHLGMVATTEGVTVQQTKDFIGVSPSDYEELVIFSLVDHMHDLRPVSSPAAKRTMHHVLSKYYTWATQTSQPVIMHDIFKPEQWAELDEGNIHLFDTDSYFAELVSPNGTPTHTNGLLRQALRDIQQSANRE